MPQPTGELAASTRLARLLVVVGLEFEARRLERVLASGRLAPPSPLATRVRAVGPGAGKLSGLDAALTAWPPDAVLAAGLAGGCAPQVRSGDVVIASAVVVTASGAWLEPHAGLLASAIRASRRAGVPHHVGPVVTAPTVVGTPEAKAELWRRHGSLAVDMESAHVMAWAARRAVPALAVRAVADGPEDSLPPAVARLVGPGGRLGVRPMLRAVGRPGLVRAAWRLWRRSAVALDHLTRVLTALLATALEF